MTLNGVMAVTLRYFTEFGKHTFQHIGLTAASSCGGIYAGVYCILYHVYDDVVKKVHVRISSPDEFLVLLANVNSVCRLSVCRLSVVCRL